MLGPFRKKSQPPPQPAAAAVVEAPLPGSEAFPSDSGLSGAGASASNDAAVFLESMQDSEVIERVRCIIKDAHVFKLPPRQTAGGWRGADWKDKVWQGTVKVVERGELTAILLVDRTNGSMFAVCPLKEGAVDRCVDSSRYFVLRIENANGRHMFIGVAFNERNDAFDFNTSLEDSKREREIEKTAAVVVPEGPPKDYSIKDGEKIHVSIPKPGSIKEEKEKRKSLNNSSKSASTTAAAGGFLKPSMRDTPRRASSEGGAVFGATGSGK